jgi:hypothetical protein
MGSINTSHQPEPCVIGTGETHAFDPIACWKILQSMP